MALTNAWLQIFLYFAVPLALVVSLALRWVYLRAVWRSMLRPVVEMAAARLMKLRRRRRRFRCRPIHPPSGSRSCRPPLQLAMPFAPPGAARGSLSRGPHPVLATAFRRSCAVRAARNHILQFNFIKFVRWVMVHELPGEDLNIRTCSSRATSTALGSTTSTPSPT